MRNEDVYPAKVLKMFDVGIFDVVIDLGFGISCLRQVRLAGKGLWTVKRNVPDLELRMREYIEDVLPRGSKVTLQTYQERDTLGRYLVEIVIGEVRLTELLIDNGFIMNVKEE